jgi:hypothetical protein
MEGLIVTSGLILILLGLGALLCGPGVTGDYIGWWHLFVFLSGPLFIITGASLFTFKEWARRLAIFSYSIILLHVLFFNILCYYFVFYLGYYRPETKHWDIRNIIVYLQTGQWLFPFTCLLITVLIIWLLFACKNKFKTSKK